MAYTILIFLCAISSWSTITAGYTFFNPFVKVVRYDYPSYYTGSHSNYVNHLPLSTYPYYPLSQSIYESGSSQFDSHLNTLPTINILAEKPYNIEKSFTVVPMLVVPAENLNMITNGHITNVSKKKPLITVKANNKDIIQCTPAARIMLENPLTVYSLKSSIIFPSQMSILHENVRVPIKVGAVIVPVAQDTVVSEESPVTVTFVYAIPTKPMQVDIDYVNNEKDVIIDANSQSVIVENEEATTVVQEVDESELVNRNPPIAPAGIVQSFQPIQENLEVFQNSKESSILTALREESKKRI